MSEVEKEAGKSPGNVLKLEQPLRFSSLESSGREGSDFRERGDR